MKQAPEEAVDWEIAANSQRRVVPGISTALNRGGEHDYNQSSLQ